MIIAAAGPRTLNLVRVANLADLKTVADRDMVGHDVRLAVSGFTLPPDDHYFDKMLSLGRGIRDGLGQRLAFETSPTAGKGSVDAAVTQVAQEGNVALFYLTAEHDVKYILPDELPAGIDRERFMACPMHVLPNGENWDYTIYSEGNAVATNSMLMAGGREVAVNDFTNAVIHQNPVILIDDSNWGGVQFDEKKNRPLNGTRYVIEQMEAFLAGRSLPYPAVRGFTATFLEDNAARLKSGVDVIHTPDAGGVAPQVVAWLQAQHREQE